MKIEIEVTPEEEKMIKKLAKIVGYLWRGLLLQPYIFSERKLKLIIR
jgi:hypothetical protein